MLVDGTFAPLDLLFSESQMLTILRSVPVGRYLQPQGNWQDGLNCPFAFLRDEKYVKVALGGTRITQESVLSTIDSSTRCRIRLTVVEDGVAVLCAKSLQFHRDNPFVEHVTFVVHPETSNARVVVELLVSAVAFASAEHLVSFTQTTDATSVMLLDKSNNEVAQIELKFEGISSGSLSNLGSKWMPHEEDHPLVKHDSGGRSTMYDTCIPGCSAKTRRPKRWLPVRPLALQYYDGMHEHQAHEWQVPSPTGDLDDTTPPPVANVTAIYGMLAQLYAELTAD